MTDFQIKFRCYLQKLGTKNDLCLGRPWIDNKLNFDNLTVRHEDNVISSFCVFASH